MNVPQENSPVVNAPTTRSWGGSRVVISATWAVTSLWRKSRICWSRLEVWIWDASAGVCVNESQFMQRNPARVNTMGPAARRFVCRIRCTLFILRVVPTLVRLGGACHRAYDLPASAQCYGTLASQAFHPWPLRAQACHSRASFLY